MERLVPHTNKNEYLIWNAGLKDTYRVIKFRDDKYIEDEINYFVELYNEAKSKMKQEDIEKLSDWISWSYDSFKH